MDAALSWFSINTYNYKISMCVQRLESMPPLKFSNKTPDDRERTLYNKIDNNYTFVLSSQFSQDSSLVLVCLRMLYLENYFETTQNSATV